MVPLAVDPLILLWEHGRVELVYGLEGSFSINTSGLGFARTGDTKRSPDPDVAAC